MMPRVMFQLSSFVTSAHHLIVMALTDYLKNVGIEHCRTTSYNPQANGKVEWFNGMLKAIIAKSINNKWAGWEDPLATLLGLH